MKEAGVGYDMLGSGEGGARVNEPIIDSDGHIYENDREILEYLEDPYQAEAMLGFPFFPTLDGFHRGAVISRINRHKSLQTNAKIWTDVIDRNNIEFTVLYPTAGLGFGFIQDPDWATVLARGYNNWLHDRYYNENNRLRGVALIPMQDPAEAVKELHRAVKELKMLGAVVPAHGLRKPLGHEDFFPIYEAAEQLNVPIAIHGAASAGLGFDFFDKFAQLHSLSHPVSQMIQITSIALGGVLDRFPKLRIAFLEAGVGWAVFMMDRLDRSFEIWKGQHHAEFTAEQRKPPSEHLRSGRVYFTAEGNERLLPTMLELLDNKCVMYASDFPHENNLDSVKHDIAEVDEDDRLPREARDNMLRHTALEFYGLNN